NAGRRAQPRPTEDPGRILVGKEIWKCAAGTSSEVRVLPQLPPVNRNFLQTRVEWLGSHADEHPLSAAATRPFERERRAPVEIEMGVWIPWRHFRRNATCCR